MQQVQNTADFIYEGKIELKKKNKKTQTPPPKKPQANCV